jgi:small subunit ribosomal protein S5
MAERLRDNSDGGAQLESTTVGIYRTAAVAKGGRRFSFSALVVVGDRNGKVGLGYGKAPGVPAAIEKAQKDARKQIVTITRNGTTIPHQVTGRFGASKVRLIPAAPGTGVIAGGTVRAVLEMAGISDCLSKSFGSTNQKNLTKAALEGLKAVQTRETFNDLRGVAVEASVVDEKIAMGSKFMAKTEAAPPTKLEIAVKEEEAPAEAAPEASAEATPVAEVAEAGEPATEATADATVEAAAPDESPADASAADEKPADDPSAEDKPAE